MNRTVLILNLLVSSMSMARPIDVTTANIEDENYTMDDPTPRIADETEYDVIPLARKDDVITTSELTKVYTSEENKFAKTRSLKDETENNRLRKLDLNPESRVANSKVGQKLANKPQEKSDNKKQVEIETKSAKREERKSTERSFPIAKEERIFKAGKKEEKTGSNAEVVEETKSGKKEQSEVEERSGFNAEDVEETKSGEKEQSEVEERSSSNAEDVEETKSGEKEQSEVEERSGSNAEDVEETKSGKKHHSEVEERSRTAAKTNVESKDAMKEESRIEKDTSELIGLERTTETLRREVKSADNLENDDDINDKVASDENSERIGYEVPVNDETNSAWDALDDIPLSRRMLSLPANLNIELKSKAGSENVDPVVARIVPEIKIASGNPIAYGLPNIPVIPIPQIWSTVSVPHIHPAILPARRFIVPGILKIRPAPPNTPINDFRRLQSQETNNIISQNTQPVSDYRHGSDNVMNQNQNVVVDNDERSQTPPKFRDVPEDYHSKENSNAYPYTPPNEDLKTPKMPQTSTAKNPLFAKLVEASGHPQRFNPNRNGNNVHNIQTVPFNNYARPNNNFNNENVQSYPGAPYPKYVRPNTYAAPQSIYKYVPGFGRLR